MLLHKNFVKVGEMLRGVAMTLFVSMIFLS